MAILNITEDSFSDDGLLKARGDLGKNARQRMREAAAQGADLLDIGGMSTRPGAPDLPVEEEIRRILPVVSLARDESALPVSIDTFRAEVAVAALDQGAQWVNSVWGLKTPRGEWNVDLADRVAEREAMLVLTHNRPAPAAIGAFGGHFVAVEYEDVIASIRDEWRQQVQFALSRGIAPERLVLDPGLGFGKTPGQNLEILRRLGELQGMGLPILVGASRKSFLGWILDGTPPADRDTATAAVTALAVQAGAAIVRVHNVAVNAAAARVAEAICRAA